MTHQVSNFESNIPLGLTFDDVLLLPQYSDINSRFDININTRFSRNVPLKIPFVSSPMDTVTEYDMAVEMARNGGLGIIHRFLTIEEQADMVARVKSTESHLIENPVTILKNQSVKEVRQLIENHNINTFLVVQSKHKSSFELSSPAKRKSSFSQNNQKEVLIGILTNRDLRFAENESALVEDIMTKKVVSFDITKNKIPGPQEFLKIMNRERIEKIPLVDEQNQIHGLVTMKDVLRMTERPQANLDAKGQLFVGAAVGAMGDYMERAEALIKAGCDVLVVDVANGHNQLCIDTVKKLKTAYPDTDVVAGSIATGEGALNLIKAGADGIRCGIGNGSICITRVVAGAGVPQLSALFDVAPICKQYNIPLISDGGNRCSGNMCKALAAGASCIMLGRLVGGCEESPSKVIYRDGKLVKIYRGMAGYGANVSKSQRMGLKEPSNKSYTPEGVEGYIPYAGPLKDVINQFTTGIRSGMSYVGSRNIEIHQQKARFIRMSTAGFRESGVHDINKI